MPVHDRALVERTHSDRARSSRQTVLSVLIAMSMLVLLVQPSTSFIPSSKAASATTNQMHSRREFFVRRAAWDDWIPDLPEEYRQVGPLKFGPRPRPFGLLLMPFLLYAYFAADQRKAAFRRLDSDKDMVVTLKEFSAGGGSEGTFTKVDRNADGELTSNEYLFSLQ